MFMGKDYYTHEVYFMIVFGKIILNFNLFKIRINQIPHINNLIIINYLLIKFSN